MRTVHVRTGIVLSPTGGCPGQAAPPLQAGRRGTDRVRSPVPELDHARRRGRRASCACLDDDALAGPVNATAPVPATDAELARALGAALHRPAVLPVPSFALKLALGPEMATDMVLAGQRAVPHRLTAAGFTFRHPDLDEAVRSVLTG